MSRATTVRIKNISKSFGPVAALQQVSLGIEAGTVHGLLGENGAGKSTLMNLLFGLCAPDAGTIAINGVITRIASPRDAQRLGIGMVHQHFKLVPTLSVLDNLALAVAPGLGVIDRRALADRLATLAASLHWTIAADTLVSRLSVGEQQRLEILKALAAAGAGAGRTLILDEPTAVLTPQEVDELLPALRTLAAQGTAVVFISHKLPEIERVCDAVSVLRQGRLVHSGAMNDIARDQLAEKMIGTPPDQPARTPAPPAADAPLRLELKALGVDGVRGGPPALREASLTVRAGEIVGIAGVDGNGQGSLVEAVLGLCPRHGSVLIAGRPATAAVLRRGGGNLGVIPEDRRRQALALPLSVLDNLLLDDCRSPPFARRGWLDPAAWRHHGAALVKRYDVRTPSLTVAVEHLSGGNQQKVVIARELHGRPRLIIAVNPTRGLDLGATAFVMRQLIEARDGGAGVLLIHSDLDELLALSDRVLVLYGGRLRDSGWPAADRAAIGRLMLGLEPLTKAAS